MMKGNLMIDLETLGTSVDSVILSIGYAIFTYEDGIIDSGEIYPSIVEQHRMGRAMSSETVDWWHSNSPREFERLLNIPGRWRCSEVSHFFRRLELTMGEVWANSPSFDLSILRDYLGGEVFWPYYDERDFRTLKNLPGCRKVYEAHKAQYKGIHNSKDDAVFQARVVVSCYRRLLNATYY